MQALINNSLLKTLKPEEKPYDVRDTKLIGFMVRVYPSGIKSYVVAYARAKRITLGNTEVLTPAQARDMATGILADVVKGGDPQAAKQAAKVDTLKAYLAHEYGPWVEAHRKDGKATLARLTACFVPEFGDKKLSELNAWIIEKWRSHRLKSGIRPATVNRDLTAIKAALAKAVEWRFIPAHPLADLKPSKVDHAGKVRFLSDEEEASLLQALDQREERKRTERDTHNQWLKARKKTALPSLEGRYADHLKPLVILALNTGMRRGELLTLAWADIDMPRAMLTVNGDTAKSGKTRHIPLNTDATTAIETWRETTGQAQGLVFPGDQGERMGSVKTAFNRLLTHAGIENFRFHDLRHTFASKLVMAGVDLNTVRELLGHSDIKMTLRYAHLAPEHKALAVARLVKPTATAPADLTAYRQRKAANAHETP